MIASMLVKDALGAVHAYGIDEDDDAVTFCGLDCGAWAVQLGGEPTCEDCRRLADGNPTPGGDDGP